jgi:hypothetical protein
VILVEAVAAILLALGSALILRALISADIQEAGASVGQEPPADYRRAA